MRKLKTNRSLAPYLLLGFLTCGIYNLWYLHHMVKDINEICREDGRHSPGILVYALLSLVTLGLYSLFWWYRLGDMVARAAHKRSLYVSISGVPMALYMLFGSYMCVFIAWFGLHKMFEATNELADLYNDEQAQKINN